jgi:PAS domain S-box-containing protein
MSAALAKREYFRKTLSWLVRIAIMKEQQPLSIADIAPEDWNLTPEPVQRLVEALLARVKQGDVLLEDQSHLTQFLDATPIGIAVHDSTGQLAYVNHVGRELLGIDRPSEPEANRLPEIFQIYRTSSQMLYPVEELPSNLALAGKTVQVNDLEIHGADQVVPLEVWATPIFDDRGQIKYAIAAFQDITERVRSEAKRHQIEQALAASERRYRQLVQTQIDCILRSLPDTTITFANDALCRALGQSLEQLTGQKWCDFADIEDLPHILQQIATLTPDDSSFIVENCDRRADNQERWTQWVNQGIFNPQGHLVEVQSVGRNITALKQAKAALRESEKRYRQVVENTLQGVWIIDIARRTTYVNPRMAEMLGYTIDEMIEKDLFHFMDEQGKAIAHENLERRHQGLPEQHDFRFKTKTGQDLWALISSNPLHDATGKYVGAWGMITDITDRKRAEVLLTQREQEFRTLAENAPDIIVRCDRDLRYRYVNPAIQGATGLLPQDFIGKTGCEVGLPAAYMAPWDAAFTRTFTTAEPQHLELSFPAPDGMKQYEVRFVPEFAADGSVVSVLAISHDTTEQKQLEQALRQRVDQEQQRVDQEQTLRRILQAIHKSLSLDLIFRTATVEVAKLMQADRTAIVQYLPERHCWKHVSEYRQSLDISTVFGIEIPDQDNPLAEQLKQFKIVRIDNPEVLKGEVNQQFAQLFPGCWLLVPLIVDQKLWGSFSLLRSRQMPFWSEEQADLMQTIADQVAIAIQQAQAFERAQIEIVERQQAEADLRSALAQKEVLLKEIHHRVKNNLQIVSGLLHLQAQSLQDSPALQALRESQNRVESMSLIHQKLYISSNLEQIDAADYIQSLATNLLTTYQVSPQAIVIQVDVEPVILSLDQGMPCGLILNELISNALKYAFPSHQPGEIRIQLHQLGHELELIIQDNGIGLPNHLDLTNTQSLGLSLVQALSTEQLEGRLTVDRRQGTTFKIKFPQSAS